VRHLHLHIIMDTSKDRGQCLLESLLHYWKVCFVSTLIKVQSLRSEHMTSKPSLANSCSVIHNRRLEYRSYSNPTIIKIL